ncbi:heparinase II/III domain-containing protein [Ructibacterium gallinarum]|uniref:Heparinase II/III family protein n=1 Tax=Ructibacterium gallinarum TaxID=2779355 RepID=A0A9D5R9Q1_9FIRM|nr:heparinase II/III family protein [Ructibacterium gallinarum]MBE5041247.1 heparinase II/III family protein [Ructibacterium gallinarum]
MEKIRLKRLVIYSILSIAILLSSCPDIFAAQDDAVVDNIDELIDDDAGDYTYFHSDYPNTGNILSATAQKPAYFNLSSDVSYDPNTSTVVSGENTITFGRLDYRNANRSNAITLHKGVAGKASDCYIDVKMEKAAIYGSEKVYQYFVIESDVTVPEKGASILLFRLRDSALYNAANAAEAGTGYHTDVQIAAIDTHGNLKLSGSQYVWNDYVDQMNGEAAHWKCYVNLENHTMEVYINNIHVGKGISFSSKFTKLTQVRVSLDNGDGTGDLMMEHWQITGLAQPYVVDEADEITEVRSSVFYDDTDMANYLSDKIVLSKYADFAWKKGERIPLSSKPVQIGEDLYVTVAEFNRIFDANLQQSADMPVISSGNDTKISVKYAAEQQALCTIYDGDGTMYFGTRPFDNAISADTPIYKRPFYVGTLPYITATEELRSYVLYQRPDAATISADFGQNASVPHPRLFITDDDITQMKIMAEQDALLRRMLDYNIQKADSAFSDEAISYRFQDTYRMHDMAEQFKNNMQLYGFAYLLTGNEKYAQRAWDDLSAVSQFPDLNTAHIIDTGMFLNGLGIAYDWMYDVWTEEQKTAIVSTIVELGLKPLSLAYYGRLQGCAVGTGTSTQISGIFPKWSSNYNTIVNNGITVAALAIMEENPAFCSEMLENAVRSIEYTLKCFDREGGWAEGPIYWGKTMTSLSSMIGAIEFSLGSDYGLLNAPGLDKTAEYIISMQSENGINNYHDANDMKNPSFNNQLTWLGIKYANEAIISHRKMQLFNDDFTTIPLEAICYFHGIDFIQGTNYTAMPKVITTSGTVESFSTRSAYFDANAFWVSAHGGTVGAYHSHNDAGAFVFDMAGEKWAVDLGTENYNSGIADNQLYRKRTEGHNTLTINNDAKYNQTASAYVPLIEYEYSDTEAYCVYDMSEAYDEADTLKRGFFVDKSMSELTVRDEITLNRSSEVYWYMHTKAEVTVDSANNRMMLTQNGKRIYLTWNSNVVVDASETGAATPPESLTNAASQNQNQGVTRIALKLSGSGQINLEVRFSQFACVPSKGDIDSWSISESTSNAELLLNEDFGENTYGMATAGGKFGRANTDRSICLTDDWTIQNIPFTENLDGAVLYGSMYYAFENTPGEISIQWSDTNFAQIAGGGITVCDKTVPVHHVLNKWYHLEFVLQKASGEGEDVLYVFRDDELLAQEYISNTAFCYNTLSILSNAGNSGAIWIDDMELIKQPEGYMLYKSPAGFSHVCSEIEKFANKGIFYLSSNLQRKDIENGGMWSGVSNIEYRDQNGYTLQPEHTIDGKYIDITCVDGRHVYWPVKLLTHAVLYQTDGYIETGLAEWHAAGTWSRLRGTNQNLQKVGGIGGKDTSDLCTVWYGPYMNQSEYLDYSVVKDTQGDTWNALFNGSGTGPIRISGSILVSGDVNASLEIKSNNSSQYIGVLRFGDGTISTGGQTVSISNSGEWMDFSVTLYTLKKYVDISIPGQTETCTFRTFSNLPQVFNIIRFGAYSSSATTDGYIALDNIKIEKLGANEEAWTIVCRQNGALVENFFSEGELNFRAVPNTDLLTGVLVAALYSENTFLEFAIDEDASDDLECFLPTKNKDAQVCVMLWNDLETMKPLIKAKRLKYYSMTA